MSRLTYRGTPQMTEDGMITPTYSDYPTRRIIEKLADYEEKQEQGLLIELPVPIGGTVYEIVDRLDHKKNGTYKDISISTVIGVKGNEKNPVILVCEGYCGTEKHFTPSAFGIRAFATRSEAEEALAKMGGN